MISTPSLSQGIAYTGPVIHLKGKTITINGNGIVLDAKGSGHFFDVTDTAGLILSHVTLCGGHNSDGDDGAIYSVGSSTINIYSSNLMSNTASSGGAIYCYHSTVNIHNSTLMNNSTSYQYHFGGGGAIYATGVNIYSSILNSNEQRNMVGASALKIQRSICTIRR